MFCFDAKKPFKAAGDLDKSAWQLCLGCVRRNTPQRVNDLDVIDEAYIIGTWVFQYNISRVILVVKKFIPSGKLHAPSPFLNKRDSIFRRDLAMAVIRLRLLSSFSGTVQCSFYPRPLVILFFCLAAREHVA